MILKSAGFRRERPNKTIVDSVARLIADDSVGLVALFWKFRCPVLRDNRLSLRGWVGYDDIGR